MIKNIAKRFNRAAEHSFGIAASKSFLGFAFLAGLGIGTYSTTAGLVAMAAPTIYAGFGLASKVVAMGLEKLSPSN
jgi:hypothetical protein